MLIINESGVGAFLLTTLYHISPCYYLTCYLFPALAQKEKMEWNSSTRSSRLRVAPVAVFVVLWSLTLFHFAESRLSL
jgi:hypothetical protein